ncbi:phosphoesterase HXTX [Pedobacter yulinensis]|uniref:Phosphoesterase HXTX n=1 Tax=Pedobacter yulinensis TaxID=2126353 RepID=A0A2T3HNB0_9SPHI|nr:2'-5' RNA ligase family protein [Pedobacter yulinensis]PST83916.1 phosphoesterase HXTX [Pedobacter yulinensis]
MQEKQKQPLILTLRIDGASQTFFDAQRSRYFPPAQNFLQAHLTLFHQLPDQAAAWNYLQNLSFPTFHLEVNGLMLLGSGVAYTLESAELLRLHALVARGFVEVLVAQDRQKLRPHVTIQNKTQPEIARALLADLMATFKPFRVKAEGIDLWTYLGGPWQHRHYFPFV